MRRHLAGVMAGGHESRWFHGPAGRLDARLHGPAGGRPVVLLHAHPAFGGTMGTRLVHDLAEALGDAGYRAVRFDFRGAGRSDGEYDDGHGEADDALAVYDALHVETGQAPVVVGFSFGGGVAVRVARERRPPRLVLVATPAEVRASGLRPADEAAGLAVPTLLVVGTQDPFLTREGVRRLAEAFDPPARVHALQGAGHFLSPDHIPRAVAAVLDGLSG